ncbi:hypothetical protein GGH14_000728 [Coemansia sp. RSA 370]|nr:hypothetical protein IW144_000850 [Coemansia sp. RSA 522]KAJ2266611.1 hypothetical protein J3F81_005408 [Coemansia sp. RSA 371]KAJ2283661.1 hypothetical protein GGH14_000728 [Coemansia sp. RSA 370]
MAQFNEDTKAYKRTNKRQRATTANPTASKKKKTSRKPSSARSVLTPSTSARARLPSNASAVSARMPVYVDSMRMFNEPDILATDVNLHATTTSSIHDYSSYGSSVMHLMQSPISLPVSVQMPVQTPAMPMASVYHSPPVSYMPQTHYPLHSLAPMDYSAAPMLPIDIQAWNTLASTVDTTEPALSFSQAVQSSVNALALDNLAVPHLPFTAAETNPYMGHSTHTNASLLDVVSSAFTTIDGHNIPANFTELNSTIPDVLSFNAAAPAFWDHEQANPH